MFQVSQSVLEVQIYVSQCFFVKWSLEMPDRLSLISYLYILSCHILNVNEHYFDSQIGV